MTTKKTPPPAQSEHEDQVDQNPHHDLPADAPAGDLTRRHFIGGAALELPPQRQAATSS